MDTSGFQGSFFGLSRRSSFSSLNIFTVLSKDPPQHPRMNHCGKRRIRTRDRRPGSQVHYANDPPHMWIKKSPFFSLGQVGGVLTLLSTSQLCTRVGDQQIFVLTFRHIWLFAEQTKGIFSSQLRKKKMSKKFFLKLWKPAFSSQMYSIMQYPCRIT